MRDRPLPESACGLGMALVCCFALLASSPSGSWAQSPGEALRIGIIDAQRILRESSAMAALSENVEAVRSDHQVALRDGEREIREADRNLAIERTQLNPSVYAQKRRALELQATTLQRSYREKMRAVDTTFRQGLAQIQQQLTLITQEIAAERGLDLVLAKATVVLVRPDLEITDDALLRLNERLPEVRLPGLTPE